ncbi:ABC transporter permease [Bombilactobacillus thymidiniphilus]|uniref:ABC transporter permease n=1 Tax=Bombilactobacillus thymidiniphilus TaxID=2923363 RepID=A0ABY4PC54_9LACO|nr:ABC transporter permease [Bombilactobacillus thymidiniphilus]UQS83345.1 ABC transporter permease [Bombilactobacillus thymidiniphilus]
MKTLWQKRLGLHLKQQSKFLKLVFNEYFIIAIIFMLGAFGFWYSKALDHLVPNTWWVRPVGIIVLTIVVICFQAATLLQQADATFLLPKEVQLQSYLKRCRNYSLIMPTATVILIGFFLTPLWARGANWTPWNVAGVTLVAVIDVVAVINNEISALYSWKNNFNWRLSGALLTLISLIIAVYWQFCLGLLIAVLGVVLSFYLLHNVQVKQPLNWLYMVKKEEQRSYRLKRFYNLFTDVPGLISKVKRRRLLDTFLRFIKTKQANTYLYLFARTFIRNTDYSGLFLRLTIIAMLLAYAINNVVVITIVSALFIYLVEFQLIPLYKNYDNNVLLQIYPVTVAQKDNSLKQLLWLILLIQWLLITIVLVIIRGVTLAAVIPSGISLVFLIVLLMLYLPRQLQKLNN